MKDGGKVYFCCENCPKAFEKDPEKFAHESPPATAGNRPNRAGRLPGDGQASQQRSDRRGRRCKMSASAARIALPKVRRGRRRRQAEARVRNAELEKGFTRQTKCPVSGKPINAAALGRVRRQEGLLLLPELPGRVRRRPGEVPGEAAAVREGQRSARRNSSQSQLTQTLWVAERGQIHLAPFCCAAAGRHSLPNWHGAF